MNCEIVKGEGKGLTSKDDCPDNEEGNKSLSSVKFDRLLQPGTSEKIESAAKDIHATKLVPDRIGLVDMGLSSLPDIVITAFMTRLRPEKVLLPRIIRDGWTPILLSMIR